MFDLWREFVYAARALSKTRAATVCAILSLALGIGANTAVFSLINALVLRRLPVPDPAQLVSISTHSPDDPYPDHLSLAMLGQLRLDTAVFSTLFAWSDDYRMATFQVDDLTYGSTLNEADENYFAVLGVRPLHGRLLTAEDAGLNSGSPAPVAVLDYRCWKNRYHSDPVVIGKTIRVEGRLLTIVGVTPEKFTGPVVEVSPEVTVPLGLFRGSSLLRPKTMPVGVMGRLKPGITPAQAQAWLSGRWPAILEASAPDGAPAEQRAAFFRRKIHVESAATGISHLRERQSRSLGVLMALVGLLLLIVGVNLASLTAARASARQHEIGIRIALGAGRWQLIRQTLIESVMLSVAGAAMGLPFALWTGRGLIDLSWSGYTPTTLDPAPDFLVLGFTLAAACMVAVLFGLIPARGILGYSPAGSLRRNSRTTHAGAGNWAKFLLAAQIALSILLVTGAVLLVRTLQNMRTADLGFRGERVLLVHLFPQSGAGKIPDRAVYYRALAESLGQLRGVESVSYSRSVPFTLFETQAPVSAASSPAAPLPAVMDFVGPGFFHLLGMRVLSGREFDWGDNERAPRVVIVSESLAWRLFPGENPIGRKIDLGARPEQRSLEIAGVVNNASLWSARSRAPLAAYVPILQAPAQSNPMIDIRMRRDDPALAGAVRRTVESAGYHFPLRIQWSQERANAVLAPERIMALMSTFVGGLALLLAAIGIYAAVSYSVVRRTSEIGVRMALGAQRGHVIGLVLREVAWLTLAGLAAGLACALAASRLATAFAFGASLGDPAILALSVAIVVGVSICAAWLPSRRTLRIDPITALRSE